MLSVWYMSQHIKKERSNEGKKKEATRSIFVIAPSIRLTNGA